MREEVARNHHADASVLVKLARDTAAYVRRAAASNATTPPETLHAFRWDRDWSVVASVARNVRAPERTLKVLGYSTDPRIRQGVAANSLTPPALLKALASDWGTHVREEAARNTATPVAALVQLADNPTEPTREGVAGNTLTPTEVVARLSRASWWKYGKRWLRILPLPRRCWIALAEIRRGRCVQRWHKTRRFRCRSSRC